MSAPRFFVSELPEFGQVELLPNESKHAAQVLRLVTGDQVVLFDGRGGEAQACIRSVESRRTVVSIEQRTDIDRELPFVLELLVALPKGERQRVLVEGLTQLGVTRLIPLVTERGVAQPTSNALERLRRFVLESSKQCGRNTLMEVGDPVRLSSLLASPKDSGTSRIFAHPYGQPEPVSALRVALQSCREIQVAIGPEGGFTPEEAAALLAAEWMQLSLGPRMLRVEMAAIATTVAITTQ